MSRASDEVVMSRRRFVPFLSGGLTHHARHRAIERDIPRRAVDLVRQFGRRESHGRGFQVTTDGMAAPPGLPPRDWSGTRGVVVVEDAQRTVMTVYRRPAQKKGR